MQKNRSPLSKYPPPPFPFSHLQNYQQLKVKLDVMEIEDPSQASEDKLQLQFWIGPTWEKYSGLCFGFANRKQGSYSVVSVLKSGRKWVSFLTVPWKATTNNTPPLHLHWALIQLWNSTQLYINLKKMLGMSSHYSSNNSAKQNF